jgi:ribosomal protein S18 acetylase RimI-like enzyme
MIHIKEITVEETYNLRKKELRKGMDLPSTLTGDLDNDTLHIGLFLNKELVSIVSFMKSDYKEFSGIQYQLRGMATLEDFQGKGYGKLLLEKAEEILNSKGTAVIWCHARVVALGFYNKLGYTVIGKEFSIPQIGRHFVMFKKLI